MRIGGDGVLASLALGNEPLRKKGLAEWREVGVSFHGVTPFHRASSRSLAAVISFGVLVRHEWHEVKAHLGFIFRPVSVWCGMHFFARFGK
jgi:hypothetical protein